MRLERAPGRTSERRLVPRRRLSPGERRLVAPYGVLGLAIVFYCLSVIARRGHYSTALDGWLVDVIELCAAALCLSAAKGRPHLRAATICLGTALLC